MGLHGQKLPAHPPSTQVNSRGKQLHSLLERLSLFSTPRGTQYGPFGTTTTPVPSKMVFIGVANGPITARVGDTMGIGQVYVVQPNATWAGGPPPTLTSGHWGNNGFSDLLGGLCIVKHTGQRQWN